VPDPFSYFAFPDSFSTVPRVSCPVFIFCAPGLVQGSKQGGLYLVSVAPQALLCQQNTSQLWHLQLGHASLSQLNSLVNRIKCSYVLLVLLAKAHRILFSSFHTIVTKPLELIHCDV
jgi:hypothetical protein